MGAGDIISPGNQILALTAKKAIPKSATIAKGKIFVLIKKTHYHGDKPHTIAVFGDIDIESGKKILNSIEVKH